MPIGFAIADDGGLTECDVEYVQMGLIEGWLEYCGYHFSGDNLIKHYRLKG